MRQNKSLVRLAVIGAGAMGTNHIRAIAEHEHCDLVGIIDADIERSQAIASQYSTKSFGSIEEVMEGQQVDGFVVATTTRSHFSVCSEIIELKIPLLVEKPITDDLTSTLELVELAKENKTPMMCGFVERFNPSVQTALSLIIEPILHMASVRHSPQNPRATASVVYDLLIHDLDLALLFHNWNNEVLDVQSSHWTPLGSNTDEICDSVITFKDGALASLSASRWGQRKIREIRVTTENSLLEIDLLRTTVTVYKNVMQESVLKGGSVTYRAQTIVDIPFVRHQGEPLSQQISHFRRLILGEIDFTHERKTILESHKLAARIQLNRTENR